MSTIEVIVVAIVIGALVGLSIGIGTARMFHAPDKQGLGAFRTLGEINACNGDPVSHAAFGLGFFFNSAAAAVGTGALTQDILHRVIPNWGIGLANIFAKKRDSFQIMRSPLILGISCTIIGVLVMPLIIVIYQYIPSELSSVAQSILTPAANWLFSYIMPVLFLLAALDAGKKTGTAAIIFGAVSQFISGNALPGIVLGILVGSAWEKNGLKSSSFWILFIITIVLFVLIAYFREFTWEKFMGMQNVKSLATKAANDFGDVNRTLDLSVFVHPGIVNEV